MARPRASFRYSSTLVLLSLVGCGGKSVTSGAADGGGVDGGGDARAVPHADPNAECGTSGGDTDCPCKEGFERASAGADCADVDECRDGTSDCDENATCDNTEGGFTCSCNDGFVGDGTLCFDVNECVEGTDDCDTNATCDNTSGSHTCTCLGGFSGDGTTCTDIDECTLGTHDCDPVATCTNTPGAFSCACPPGYTDDSGNGTACTDIDECALGTHDCDMEATCDNTPGAFMCTCPTDMIGDGTDCQCDLEGTFAVLIETDVEWSAVRVFNVEVIAAGSATLKAWSIRTQTRQGGTLAVSTKLCGGTSPDLCSNLLGEAYAQSFPVSVFDGSSIPLVPSTLDITDASPGMPLIGGPEVQQVGIDLTQPDGTWPPTWDSPGQTFPDHDADIYDGVTSYVTSGGTSPSCGLPYAYVPHPDNASTRIKAAFVGNRVLSNLQGTLIDCDTMSGAVAGPDNGLPQGNGHVVGCLVDQGGGSERVCTQAEFDSLDQQAQNVNQRSTAARFTAVRVADGITCPDVRAMTFP